jgi:hypothetical protein
MNLRRRGVRWLVSVFLLTLSLQVGAAPLHHPLSHDSGGEHHASTCGWCQLVSQFRSHSGAVCSPPIPLPDRLVSLVDEHGVREPSQGTPLVQRSRAPPRS